MLCHENQWNAQSLSQKFDVTIEFSYEIFPAPLFVSFWSGAVDVVGGYRNDVIGVRINGPNRKKGAMFNFLRHD